MDEMELQEAAEIARALAELDVVTVAAEIAVDPMLAAARAKKLADAVIKLGGNTIRARTSTRRGIAPVKP